MSINGYLDEDNVINSIRLQLRHPSGADKVWIIVEGETDQKLFSKLVNGKHVEVEISNGGVKGLLRSVSELLKETGRIIGIRDADFMHLEGKKETAENIFLCDFHDAEMMIISCDKAYLQVIAEYLSEEKKPISTRDTILKSIAYIGGIRWLNYSESLELNFKNLSLGDIYDGKTFTLDEDRLVNEITDRSPKSRRSISKDEVRWKIKNVTDYLNLCNGHDFQKAFALFISHNSAKGVNHAEIGRAFRVAYRFEDFQKSNLYNQLKEWSDSQKRSLFKQG